MRTALDILQQYWKQEDAMKKIISNLEFHTQPNYQSNMKVK